MNQESVSTQSVNPPQTEIILIDTEYNAETCMLSNVHTYALDVILEREAPKQ